LCGKVFANPIKAENLGSKNAEVYDACPYCLTEVTVEEAPIVIEETRKPFEKETEINRAIVTSSPKKPPKVSSEAQGCSHHFGYLSQRTSKEKIPEECMTCEKIVQCMLKNVTG
jgi:hypothetical protein